LITSRDRHPYLVSYQPGLRQFLFSGVWRGQTDTLTHRLIIDINADAYRLCAGGHKSTTTTTTSLNRLQAIMQYTGVVYVELPNVSLISGEFRRIFSFCRFCAV